MKRKNCITKLVIGGGLALIIILAIYFIFL